jgi:hypothetical protein
MTTFLPAQPTFRTVARQAALVLGCAMLLTGCGGVEEFYDSKLSLDNPVDWWHQLQGGPVADERPPPPGITDPYPNLSRVPAKPAPTDAPTRAGLSAQLASQRDHARLLAAQDPVVFPPPGSATLPTAAPATPAAAAGQPKVAAAPPPAPAAQPADSDKSTMVLEAANATPAAPPAAAPRAPTTDPTAPAAFSTPPRSAGPIESGPIPAVPTAAPALPNLPGLPTSNPAPVIERPRASTQFSFAPGSAALPDSANGPLRELAVRSAGGPIAVTAGGDARSNAPGAQGAALPLALRRTGAIAAVLIGAGVPSGSIRSQAVAPGREASARLVN